MRAWHIHDLFTSTHTKTTSRFHGYLPGAAEKHYLYTERQKGVVAVTQGLSCRDRYVEGTCYIAVSQCAGDQCDGCGYLLDATLLVNPRSKIDGPHRAARTEHFYLDLAPSSQLAEFLRQRESYFPSECVPATSLGQIRRRLRRRLSHAT